MTDFSIIQKQRLSSNSSVFGVHDRRVLVLQGGGALGSYQAGVYQGLAAEGFAPNWVAGVSIGAINATLIAGNSAERRVERLHEFWHRVSAQAPIILPGGWEFAQPMMNRMSAALVMMIGVPGFFKPRTVPPFLAPEGSIGALSYYDTAPLRATLEELVDFERIGKDGVRVSLGAVNVRTGESVYFDSDKQKITVDHVMASGSPIEIDGEYYWDGGIMSNTPVQYVCENPRISALIVTVDLFSGKGPLPQNLGQVQERAKDIQYQSKQRLTGSQIRHIETLRTKVAAILKKLPDELRSDPQVQELAALSERDPLSIVHLVNRHDTGSSDYKDYEFSRATVQKLWLAGQNDMQKVLEHPDACALTDFGNEVRLYELS
jgi:NTE family protein